MGIGLQIDNRDMSLAIFEQTCLHLHSNSSVHKNTGQIAPHIDTVA